MMSCGGAEKTDYEHLREVSWDGTELTIKLGENKSTGCEWTTKPEDDSVIDYSVNRVFRLAGSQVTKGKAIGTLEVGFEGKGAGTSRVICTTPAGWDGTGAGLTYIVTVTVNEDGTIESAEGEESDQEPETDADQSEESVKTAATIEEYFTEHPDELEKMKNNINSDESSRELVEVDLEGKGNTLSYIFNFNETYSNEQIEKFKPDLEKSLEGEVAEDMKGRIPAIEESFGIKGIKIHLEYRNGDGTKIAETTIE